MSIIRTHYSTLSQFAQEEAPVAPEYPFTDILAAYQGALEEMEDEQDGEEDLMWADEMSPRGGARSGNNEPSDADASSPQRSLLGNHTSAKRNQQQQQNNDNMPESKTFQKLMKNMFGDYFVDDADEEIAADMAERWVNFAKFGDPNYEDSKANWLPWRYLPTNIDDGEEGADENSAIPWQPQEFEYMDDEFEEEEDDDDDVGVKSGYQWSDDKAERIYRKRALKALGMEVIEEDVFRTELRRMQKQSGINEMEAVFTFLFGNSESHNRQRRRQQQQQKNGNDKMSKRAIRQVQQIAQAMGVVGTGLRGEPTKSGAHWDEDFFPEMLDLKWPPEGRLVERDCTCDMWDRIRCKLLPFVACLCSLLVTTRSPPYRSLLSRNVYG